MMKIAELEGVNVYKEEYVDYNKLRERLAEGKMCIVLVKDRSHFVLCKGVTDDGRVLVNDPYGKWASTAPYTEAQLQRGSSGMVWVIDPYKNVGAASTSIGQVKVSQSVLSEIQKANAGSGYVDITSSKYLKAIEKATGTKQSGNYKSLIGPNAVSLDGTDLSDRPKLENLSTNTGDTNTETTGDNSYYPYQLSSGNTTGEGSAAATKPASSTKPTQETIPENDNQVVEVATTQTEITESTAAQSTSGSTSYSVRTWSTKTSSPVTDRYVSTSLVKETTPSEGKTLSQTISEYTTLPKVESVAPSAKYTVSSEGTKPYIEAEPSSNNIDVSNMISAEEAVTPNTEIDINSIPTPGTEIEERINIKVDSESLIAKSPTPEYKYDLVRNNQIHSSSSGSDYSKYLGLAAGILGTLAVGTAAIALMKKTEEE